MNKETLPDLKGFYTECKCKNKSNVSYAKPLSGEYVRLHFNFEPDTNPVHRVMIDNITLEKLALILEILG